MAQRVLKNFTVVDDDERGRQIGFRNLYTGDGTALVEIRINGSEMCTIPLGDFKKLVLAGEHLSELLAEDEESGDATQTT